MRKRNQPHDVFKLIDMCGGDREKCWPFKGELNDKGLPYFQAGGKKHLVYRLVYQLVCGELSSDDIARHKCDNGADPKRVRGWVCCNPYHIEPGSHQENMQDMRDRDRHGVSAHVVRNIRKLAADGRTQEQIAELYGVSRQTVSDIVRGVTHDHVMDDEQPRQTDRIAEGAEPPADVHRTGSGKDR